MKAFRLELTDYKLDGTVNPELKDAGPEVDKRVDYNVRGSIVALLLNRGLNLCGAELLVQDRLAGKIHDCDADHILLDASEMQKVQDATNRFRGFGIEDVELVQRILEAPEVDVEEKR